MVEAWAEERNHLQRSMRPVREEQLLVRWEFPLVSLPARISFLFGFWFWFAPYSSALRLAHFWGLNVWLFSPRPHSGWYYYLAFAVPALRFFLSGDALLLAVVLRTSSSSTFGCVIGFRFFRVGDLPIPFFFFF
ncbi:hypothetical protein B0H19DRAFT_647042 [Mycena capillaripes]|nr:hypothetical protein B0H19DRAFT_647042 [Mycena capillaripes]